MSGFGFVECSIAISSVFEAHDRTGTMVSSQMKKV
jgi:hypothetical protein